MHNKLAKLYRGVSKSIGIASIVVVTCSLFIDFIPRLCVRLLGCIPFCVTKIVSFTYDKGNIVPIVIVMWTFCMTLIVFILEKLDKPICGIRLSDLMQLRGEFHNLSEIITFLVELLVFAIATIFNAEITFLSMGFLQFVNTGYILLLIFVETSVNQILDKIESEATSTLQRPYNDWLPKVQGKELLLCKQIFETKYDSNFDVEQLTDMLIRVLKRIQDKKHDGQKEENQEIAQFSYMITEQILDANTDLEKCELVLRNLVSCGSFSVVQGILVQLTTSFNDRHRAFCTKLLEMEIVDREKIIEWFLAFNEHMSETSGEMWRKNYYREQLKVHRTSKQEDIIRRFKTSFNNPNSRKNNGEYACYFCQYPKVKVRK